MKAAMARPNGSLPAALRVFCEREYLWAVADMKSKPMLSVPPGERADDWTLYVTTHARGLVLEAMRLNIWRPA